MIPIEHRHLGRLDYDAAWSLQRAARQRLLDDPSAPDVLLTVEHPGVLTAGRRARPENLLRTPEDLEALGITVRAVERGGDWTWHGPGQLVGYPIVALRRRRLAVKHFVGALEDAMIAVARWAFAEAGLDVPLTRRRGHPGAWLEEPGGARRKLGATGVHIRHGVSLHGLALNLDPRPWGFEHIVPCGLQDTETTSIAAIVLARGGDAARTPGVEAAADVLAERLGPGLEAAVRGDLSSCSAS